MHPNAPLPQGGQPPLQVPAGPERSGARGSDAGELAVTIQGSRWTANLVPPHVRIDGEDVKADYGRNVRLVSPGAHQVRVWSQWMAKAGEASTAVEVPAGGVVELFYSAPVFPGGAGSLGTAPHDRSGVKVMVALYLVVALAALLLLIGILVFR